MKIIKPGREQKGWAKEFSCTGEGNEGGGCGAVLLVEEADLFQTSRGDMSGDVEYFTTFACIACGVLTDVDAPFNARSFPKEDPEAKKKREEKRRQRSYT